MFFVLSKTLGFFLVPSNLIMAFGVLGLGLIFSGRRRLGGRLLACCVAALLLCGFSPIGALMLLPLETRFSSWDPPTGDPAGIIVLGGGVDPEITPCVVHRQSTHLGHALLSPLSSQFDIRKRGLSMLAEIRAFAQRISAKLMPPRASSKI